MINKKIKALVLFSGGLDSRLTIKLLQDQGLEVEALYVQLPFGGGCCNALECTFNFSQMQGVKLHILDATSGKLFKKYVEIVKNPKHGRGVGYNPCKDCKIFLFEEGKKFAKKIGAEIIATGEVLGQRPMSQMKRDLILDETKAGLSGKILRPLSAKLLPETIYEKKGLVDRTKFYEIQGRTRKTQMVLAKRYKIKYPGSGGGCLLCEKLLKNRFKILLKRGINEEEAKLVNVGRHFLVNNIWIIIGRNKKENDFLEKIKKGKLTKPSFPGPSVLCFGKFSKEEINKLIKAYSKEGNLEDRKVWEKYKI